jgi:putative membrane protein
MYTVRPYLFSALLLATAALVPANSVQAVPKVAPGERAASAAESAMTDSQSLGVAEAASTGEAELSSSATSKVRVEVVQRLARATLNDHTQAIQEARALGNKIHLRTAPSAASNELRKEADETTAHVENATAPNVDRTYVEGSIRFHQKVVKAIDEAVLRTNSSEVKALFSDVRARVEHELEMARSALASLGQLA